MLAAAEERRQLLIRSGIGRVCCNLENNNEGKNKHPTYALRIETSGSLLSSPDDESTVQQKNKVDSILIANGLRFDHFRKARAELVAAGMELPRTFPKTFTQSKLGVKLNASDVEERRAGVENFFSEVFGHFTEYTLEQQLTLCDALPFVERHPLPRLVIPPPSTAADIAHTPLNDNSSPATLISPSEEGKEAPMLRRRNEQLYRMRSLLNNENDCAARVGVEVDTNGIHPLYTLRVAIGNQVFIASRQRFAFYASVHDLVRSFETKAASPPVHLPDFPERFMLMRIGLKLGAAAIENRRHKLQVYFAGLIGTFSHFAQHEQELLLEALDFRETVTTLPSLNESTPIAKNKSSEESPTMQQSVITTNLTTQTTESTTTARPSTPKEESDEAGTTLASLFGVIESPEREKNSKNTPKTPIIPATVYDPVLYARTTQEQLMDFARRVVSQKGSSRVLVFHLLSVDGLDAFESGTPVWISATTDNTEARLSSTIALGEDKCARWQPYYPMLFSLEDAHIDAESELYITLHKDNDIDDNSEDIKDQTIVAHAVLGNLLGDLEAAHEESIPKDTHNSSDNKKKFTFLNLSLDLIADKKESNLKGGVVNAMVAAVEAQQVLDFARAQLEAIYKYEQISEDGPGGAAQNNEFLPCVCLDDFMPFSFFDNHTNESSTNTKKLSSRTSILTTSIDWDPIGYALLSGGDWELLPPMNLAGTLPLNDNEAIIQDWTPLGQPFEYAHTADSGVWTEKPDPSLIVRRSIYYRLVAVSTNPRSGLGRKKSSNLSASGRRLSRRPSRS
uniref:Uncharacterized protein n=1 Tax=Aureoumbra lagunensis TaxID=44058 RepID=A0A7S3K2P5_9STRA|mmetsp:Transcript_22784/g.29510  ORF Transcript_22784/g.29510 Transcript_22784/m.29510 type:complete len:793 (-) Transcript_22784:370-2748(-)